MYEESRVVRRIAGVSDSRHLVYGGKSARFLATIASAMGDDRIRMAEDSDRPLTVVGGDVTEAGTRAEIAQGCAEGRVARVIRVQNGASREFLIDGLTVQSDADTWTHRLPR